jgi:hypothetical protein
MKTTRVRVTLMAALAGIGWLVTSLPTVASADGSPVKVTLPRKGFERIAHERGVTVYKNNSANLIWIGAVGVIPAPPERVEEALLDYEHQAGKIGRVSEARVLSRDAGGIHVYERLNLPIISDRDFVLRVRHGADGPQRWIAYWAITDRGPKPRDGIVRVTRHNGVWELLPTQDGKATIARCEIQIDLGGSVPLWLAKSKAGAEIPELYSNVCKMSLGQGKAGACP